MLIFATVSDNNSSLSFDNSIFSDEYIYLNGETTTNTFYSYLQGKLIKIKYNDFTDKTDLYNLGGSYGSLNPTYYII